MVQWTVTKLEPDLGTLEITLKIIIGNEKEFEAFKKKLKSLKILDIWSCILKEVQNSFQFDEKINVAWTLSWWLCWGFLNISSESTRSQRTFIMMIDESSASKFMYKNKYF